MALRILFSFVCALGLAATSQAQEPIGSIVAWHRDFPNTPLPVGWVECPSGRMFATASSQARSDDARPSP